MQSTESACQEWRTYIFNAQHFAEFACLLQQHTDASQQKWGTTDSSGSNSRFSIHLIVPHCRKFESDFPLCCIYKNITATENREQIQCKSRRKIDNVKHRFTLSFTGNLHWVKWSLKVLVWVFWPKWHCMSPPYLCQKQECLDPKGRHSKVERPRNFFLLKIRYPKQARVKTRVSVQKLYQKGLRQKSNKQKLSTQGAWGKRHIRKMHTQPPENIGGHKQA